MIETMTMLKLFIYFSIANCLFHSTLAVQYLPNVDCNSYVDFVATDPKYHRYTPYYVKLNRCNGANIGGGKPHNKRCLPTKDGISNISIVAFDSAGGYNPITLQNHTACKEKCVIDSSSCTPYQTFQSTGCDCLCKYTNPPQPDPCGLPFTWDHTKCGCVCPRTTMKCEKRKEFTTDTCGCTCKLKIRIRCTKREMLINEDSCTCVAPNVVTGAAKGTCEGDVKGGVLAVVMIMEALAFVVAYFFLYSYCYKRQYLQKKHAKNNNSLYNTSRYSNGNVPNEYTRKPNEFNTISVEVEEEDFNSDKDDKKVFLSNGDCKQSKEDILNKPIHVSDNEKSPFNDDEEWYTYNNEVDGDPCFSNNSDNHLHSPDYCDYMVEVSGDGCVTQV